MFSPLLLHDCIDMKSNFCYYLFRKGLTFTKKNPFLSPLCGGVWIWGVIRVSYRFLLMFWSPLGSLALYDGYLWSIDGFFLIYVIDSDKDVSYYILFYNLFKNL